MTRPHIQHYPQYLKIALRALLFAVLGSLALPCFSQQLNFQRLWVGLSNNSRLIDIAIRENAGYALTSRGLEVINLSDSAAPYITDRLTIPHTGSLHMRHAADDTLLLVYDESPFKPTGEEKLSIFSIAQPLAPELLGTITVPGIVYADARGRTIYATYLDDSSYYGLRTINITDIANPVFTGGSGSGKFGGFRMTSNRFYSQQRDYDLEFYALFNIQPDGKLAYVSSWKPSFTQAEDAFFTDSTAAFIASDRKRLTFYSIMPDGQFTYMLGLDALPGGYVPEKLAFLPGDSLVVIQSQGMLFTARFIGDTALEVVEQLKIGWGRDLVEQFAVHNAKLFWRSLTGLHDGTITPDGHITVDGRLSVGMACYDVAGLSLDRIVAVTTDTLYTLDFTEPRIPEVLSAYPLQAEGVAAINSGRIITLDSIITLLDISNPHEPRVLDTLHLGYGVVAWEAEVKDSIIVLCCREGGTFILVVQGDSLHRACRIAARSRDAVWMEQGLLLTTMDAAQGVWDGLEVFDSRYEWCQPGQLHAYGKPGAAIVGIGDTVIVGTGGAVLFLDASAAFPPSLIESHSVQESEAITGLALTNELLFVQTTINDKGLYRWTRNESGFKRVSGWHGLGKGSGRFFFLDSMTMFSAEMFQNLEVWQFRFAASGVDSDIAANPWDNTSATMYLAPSIVSENATVSISTPAPTNYTLTLNDALGREVRMLRGYIESGSHLMTIDVRELPPGAYYVYLRSDVGSIVQQLRCIR